MTTTTDFQLLTDFRSELPEPDRATAERVYRIATAASPPAPALRARGRMRFLVAIAAVALAIAGGASALAFHYLGPSPGFSGGFSAFEKLPPALWPASLPPVGLEHSAGYVGVSPDEFLRRLRLLQTGLALGPGHSLGEGELYAYVAANGQSACMFLTGQSGACFTADSAGSVQGVFPEISPGYPGQTPALTAIVADSIKSVELDVSGQLTRLPIVNNSVYANLIGLKESDRLALRVTYGDGSAATTSLTNPLAG